MSQKPTLKVEDFDHLRHALGIDARTPRSRWGYRQHFDPAEGDMKSMERLVDAGLMTRHPVAGFVEHEVFVVTQRARDLFGLGPK